MWSTTLKSIMLALAPFYFHKILKEELEMEKSIIDREEVIKCIKYRAGNES